jgi:hypothetical protein
MKRKREKIGKRLKGATGKCVRCARLFTRNYADHIVCKPGCDGTATEETRR